jgi:hypothetical protein
MRLAYHLSVAAQRGIEDRAMWKNVLIVVLLGVFAGELVFFGRDLLHFFGRIGIREVVIVLLIVGTAVTTRQLKHAAKRL